ncbi:hypothetical protein NDU88_007041 [Pleurodeles waltl]|uniref:Uncharacterized protein n=1 Tax=Pleurodeles waltl TaxID=8319 RepID=A0AAV7NV35_PLEWA|nr:hypothetical protein NDU88_007041 [Pleurodeles waltl]
MVHSEVQLLLSVNKLLAEFGTDRQTKYDALYDEHTDHFPFSFRTAEDAGMLNSNDRCYERVLLGTGVPLERLFWSSSCLNTRRAHQRARELHSEASESS